MKRSEIIQVTLHHRDRLTYAELPTTTAFVSVTVDFDQLARDLGPRAVRSKGGKACEASGAVVVRVARGVRS